MFHRLLGITVLVASIALAWLVMDIQHFSDTPMSLPSEGADYQLEPGSSVRTLARDFKHLGYIENEHYLQWIARWRKQASVIQAGEYRITSGTTPSQLLDLLVSGDVIRYSVTLIEGWTFRQVLSALHGHPVLKKTLSGLTDGEIMERLGHKGEHPEGRFLADTYLFQRSTSDLDLLAQAYRAMQEFLHQSWEKRDPKIELNTPYEALVLASIVEKETGLASERARISGVFMRRLALGMKLQTDPTVIYGMGDRFDGNIRRRDLQRDTPYNTYTRGGLTPTPICMPGKEAILAALHPQEGKALYFVAKGDGSHHFSATLREHNRAVRKYQLKR